VQKANKITHKSRDLIVKEQKNRGKIAQKKIGAIMDMLACKCNCSKLENATGCIIYRKTV
jgi:hypothetical protein